MAKAAIDRLELDRDDVDVLASDVMVPQVGQGALAVECRADAADLVELLSSIEHGPTRRELDAERGFLLELGGDCDLPAGASATVQPDGSLRLRGVLAAADESQLERVDVDSSEVVSGGGDVELGREAARRLMAALGRAGRRS